MWQVIMALHCMIWSFLIKYAEIGTKGKNRYLFEDALIKQIKNALVMVILSQGTPLILAGDEFMNTQQ